VDGHNLVDGSTKRQEVEMKAILKGMPCVLMVTLMLAFAGCVTTGTQQGSKGSGPATGAALEVEERGRINSVAYHVWNNEVRINTPGAPEELIKSKDARVEFEGEYATITLKDLKRKLRFKIQGMSNERPTADYSLDRVDLDGKWDKIVLHFSNGKNLKHIKKFISFQIRTNMIEGRHHVGQDTPWRGFYPR